MNSIEFERRDTFSSGPRIAAPRLSRQSKTFQFCCTAYYDIPIRHRSTVEREETEANQKLAVNYTRKSSNQEKRKKASKQTVTHREEDREK